MSGIEFSAAGRAVAGADQSAHSKELRDLKKACEQFEAVFAKKLLSEMRRGVKETQIGDQAGSEIYRDMMDQAIADSIAHRGSLGIGDLLYKQFEKQVTASRGGDIPVSKPEPTDKASELRSDGDGKVPATRIRS